MSAITLVLGGQKSGKSAFAQELFLAAPGPRLVVATGVARDLSLRATILDHKKNRPPDIPVIETIIDLPATLNSGTEGVGSVLAEGLDFWVFSCMNKDVHQTMIPQLLTTLERWTGPELFLVSCETGLGPSSPDPMTGAFVRELGRLNQELANLAMRVHLVTAGLATTLKK